MQPGGPHPVWMNAEIGYALWWLTHPEHGPTSGPEIVDRLLARGHVRNRAEAGEVLAAARRNVAAQRRIEQATGRSSLSRACGYRCDPATPIALRLRFNVVDANGDVVESRSIVIQATAGENLQAVLDRARDTFNRRYRRGTTHRSGQLRLQEELTPQHVDQVLLNYTEGLR